VTVSLRESAHVQVWLNPQVLYPENNNSFVHRRVFEVLSVTN
jgi:hypothetical protein